MKNNNKKAVRNIAGKSFRAKRTRNVLAAAAIACTCLLFTAVFTIGMGIKEGTERETMRRVGTTAHAGLKDITAEQWEKIKTHPLIKKSSYNILAGSTTGAKLLKRAGELRVISDDFSLRDHFCGLVKGRRPEAENEIVVDTIILDMLGISYELGETVPLSFDFMGKQLEKDFILSGYYRGDPLLGASQIYISDAYWDKLSAGYTQDGFQEAVKNRETQGTGLLQADLWFKNSLHIEENVQRVIRESGYEPNSGDADGIHYGVNWAYLSEALKGEWNPEEMIVPAFALLLILLAGYLIIYNIFQISVSNDIRFYGLLKMIGTTKKQIRAVIRREALLLSLAGIPMGLLLGFLAGRLLLPVVISAQSRNTAMTGEIGINPGIFLFSILFSLATVFISLRKPAKIAGNVSPVEALRYTEGGAGKRKVKNSAKGAKIHRMALQNLTRNKKKTAVVILSLSLSMILLLEVFTLIKGFSMDKYLNQMVAGDFMLADTSYFRDSGQKSIPEETKEAILSMEGVESLYPLYADGRYYGHWIKDAALERFRRLAAEGKIKPAASYLEKYMQDILEGRTPVQENRYGFPEGLYDKLKVVEGSFDQEKFEKGGYVLAAKNSEENLERLIYRAGDMVDLTTYSKESEPFIEEAIDEQSGMPERAVWKNTSEEAFEVMAVVEMPHGMSLRSYPVFGPSFLLTMEDFQRISGPVSGRERSDYVIHYADIINAVPGKGEALGQLLEDYTTQVNPSLQYESKDMLKKEFQQMTQMITLLGGGLTAVIGIIGILNFINSMMTGVVARKREFAVMQGIGMTGKQLRRLLVYEGLYYVVFVAALSLLIGTGLSKLVVSSLSQIMPYFVYQFTLIPYLDVMPVLLAAAALIPLLLYRRIRKASVVERLREAE